LWSPATGGCPPRNGCALAHTPGARRSRCRRVRARKAVGRRRQVDGFLQPVIDAIAANRGGEIPVEVLADAALQTRDEAAVARVGAEARRESAQVDREQIEVSIGRGPGVDPIDAGGLVDRVLAVRLDVAVRRRRD